MIIFIGSFTLIACRKNGDLSSSHNEGKSKLIAMSNDSLGGWDLIYTGNSVTGIKADSALVQYGNYSEFLDTSLLYSFQYINTGSSQFVAVNLSPYNPLYQSVMTYTLTPSKLPLSIDYSYSVGGIEKKSNGARFFYHLNSDILDSVIISANNGLIIFTFTYDNQNISKLTESHVYNDQKMELETYDFTYGATPNIFRQTDSLLYIYKYPVTAFYAQPMVIAAFFAETFSAATFNSVTATGILNEAWGSGAAISSNMNYSLNADGKIAEESFNNSIFEGLAGIKYYYK